MKVEDYATATCWCDRTEVEIPVSWIREGQTLSCGPGCGPGCTMAPPIDEPDDPYDEVDRPRKRWKMNKYSPARYDPADDSTPGLPKRTDAVSLLIGDGLCACGCGDHPAGRKAKFCMGHDARLKGRLTRAYSAHVQIALVEESTGTATLIDPLDYADRFSTDKVDWRKLITDGAAKIAERRGGIDKRAAEREILARAARDENVVRVGKWDQTDSAAAIYKLPEGGFEVEYVDDLGRVATQKVDVA